MAMTDAAALRTEIARLNEAAHAKHRKALCARCAGFVLDERARQLAARLMVLVEEDAARDAREIVVDFEAVS